MNLSEYQQWTRTTAIYPSANAIEYVTLGLASEAGEVADVLKKEIRDGDDRKDSMRKELGDVLWYLARVADELGTDLGEIAADNVAKLHDRQERGKLRGSGDDR